MTTSDDRRRDFRAELRTVVNVYTSETLATEPPTFLRAWSEDVSATGARLISLVPIPGSRVWLKFLAQGQGECFIEADIVRAWSVNRHHFRTNEKMNSYGVRFLRLMTEPEFMELALHHVQKLTAGISAAAPPAKNLALN